MEGDYWWKEFSWTTNVVLDAYSPDNETSPQTHHRNTIPQEIHNIGTLITPQIHSNPPQLSKFMV